MFVEGNTVKKVNGYRVGSGCALFPVKPKGPFLTYINGNTQRRKKRDGHHGSKKQA